MAQINQPSNLLDRIRALEKEIDAVRKRVGLGNATISTGDLTIQKGGTFRLLHPNGTVIAKIGDLGAIGGEEVWGVGISRPDGTEAFSVYGTESGGSTYLAIRDRSGNIVFSDDGLTGAGLATPYLNGLIAPSGTADNISACWPRTSSASYTEIMTGTIPATHPRLSIDMTAATDSGVAGSARVLINGTQVGSAITGGNWLTIDADIPGWGDTVGFLDEVTVSVQAKRNSGTGNVYAMVYRLYGKQS